MVDLSNRLISEWGSNHRCSWTLSNTHARPFAFHLRGTKICNNFFGRGTLSFISSYITALLPPASSGGCQSWEKRATAGRKRRLLLFTYAALAACGSALQMHIWQLAENKRRRGGGGGGEKDMKRCRYPRCPGNAEVFHHFFKRRRLLCLLLGMQSDFLAEFPRIVRSRHVSLFCSVFLQWSVSRHTEWGRTASCWRGWHK